MLGQRRGSGRSQGASQRGVRLSATSPPSLLVSVELKVSFRLAGRVFVLAGRECPKIALTLVPGHL